MKNLIYILLLVIPSLGIAQVPYTINVGSSPNDRTGDPIRTAYIKTNNNFVAVYDSLGHHFDLIQVATDSTISYYAYFVNLFARNLVVEDSINSYGSRIASLESNPVGGSGTGDVKVNGTTAANNIAYWSGTDSTLVSNDVVKLYADSAVFTEYTICKDTAFLKYLKGTTLFPWLTINRATGSIDSANTENNAWRGLEMAIKNPSKYINDKKLVDGHMEIRVYYVDSETKQLAYQYGWGGLDMMETQSAYQIFHEITLRWLVEAESNDNIRALLVLLIYFTLTGLLFMVFLKKR